MAENLVCEEYIDAYENRTVVGEDSLANDAEVCTLFFMTCLQRLHDLMCSVQDSDDGLGGFGNISVGKKASQHNKLDEYLALAVENVKDPLKWWFDNRMAYPNLSRMALDYLSIPGESFPILFFPQAAHILIDLQQLPQRSKGFSHKDGISYISPKTVLRHHPYVHICVWVPGVDRVCCGSRICLPLSNLRRERGCIQSLRMRNRQSSS